MNYVIVLVLFFKLSESENEVFISFQPAVRLLIVARKSMHLLINVLLVHPAC